jgi:hypothetical protein
MNAVDREGPREHIPWPIAIPLVILIPAALIWISRRAENGHDIRWLLIPGTSLVFLYSMVWGNRRYFRKGWFWGSLLGLIIVGAGFWIAMMAAGARLSLFGVTAIAGLEVSALILAYGFLEGFFLKRTNHKDVA